MLATDLDIDLSEIGVASIPSARPDEYVVSAAAVADGRDTKGDTRDLIVSIDETAGEAVASMATENFDAVFRGAREG